MTGISFEAFQLKFAVKEQNFAFSLYSSCQQKIKSAMCLAKNGKDTKHTRHIARRMHFVRNGENCKMHKTNWCEGGLQLVDIGTKNVSEPDLTPRMKYIMVRLEN